MEKDDIVKECGGKEVNASRICETLVLEGLTNTKLERESKSACLHKASVGSKNGCGGTFGCDASIAAYDETQSIGIKEWGLVLGEQGDR